MALRKRDIYFYLERLCEQTNSIIKFQYKKQFGIFRNFKIKGGNVRLTSYVLRTITSPVGISQSVSIYNVLAQSLFKYSIGPLPCLFAIYKVDKLNAFSSSQYSIIAQDINYDVRRLNLFRNDQYTIITQELIYNVNELNIQEKSCVEELSCLVNYTITKQ